MIDEMPPIRKLHSAYEELTGILIILSMQRVGAWREFIAKGYTVDDLRAVIQLLQNKMREGNKTITCLRFSTLIGNLEWFEEDLGEARALARVQKPTPRDRVLEQSGRPKQLGLADNCKSAEDVMKAQAGLAALLRLRDSL